ncbi:MAG: heparan-alpha-glucosaminide N-acetyltransferase domain-containing protein [Candidatus Cyclobacteriaceae bacterium M3_2C_046]
MNLNKTGRIASIDVARGVTMLLMIWVNDFWTLENIPKWLQHADAGEDYLGFSDLIFPWFLFIVGLSIPFAINNRLKKGQTKLKVISHIISRSLALLIMGIFLVNTESYHASATGMSKSWYVILLITGFFLVWNVYPPPQKTIQKYFYRFLQVTGILLLIYLAWIYRGTSNSDENQVVIMQTRWWGILGIIGWTYLVTAPLYLFFRNKNWILWLIWMIFIIINLVGNSDIYYNSLPGRVGSWVMGNGAFHAFAFGGITTAALLKYYRGHASITNFHLIMVGLAFVFLLAGFLSHQYFMVSKISATPPWVFYSLSSAFLLFDFFYWLVDQQNKKDWFELIKPAGIATLTCYLIPYYFYSFFHIVPVNLPGYLDSGLVGLIKSMVYAFIIIGITWLLLKYYIKLKV